jgi:hypothetical protein
MIFPTKHVPPGQSLLDAGAALLSALVVPCTVSELWERVRGEVSVKEFDRFVLALDLLYTLDAIDYDKGVVLKSTQ